MAFHSVPWRASQATSFHLQARPRCEPSKNQQFPEPKHLLSRVLLTPSDLIALVSRVHCDRLSNPHTLLLSQGRSCDDDIVYLDISNLDIEGKNARSFTSHNRDQTNPLTLNLSPSAVRSRGEDPVVLREDLTSTREERQIQQQEGLLPNQTSRRQLPLSDVNQKIPSNRTRTNDSVTLWQRITLTPAEIRISADKGLRLPAFLISTV